MFSIIFLIENIPHREPLGIEKIDFVLGTCSEMCQVYSTPVEVVMSSKCIL